LNRTPRHTSEQAHVAIIGSGFSGIAAAIALKQEGIEQFTIFELEDGIGGTWWNNRYPGAEVDLESHIYSFSYARADWSRTHASWQELQAYLEMVVDKFDLRRHLALGEKVESVAWDEDRYEYNVTTASGTGYSPFTAVISAVGVLNIPLLPPFVREAHEYRGVLCHTSTWPDGLDLTGKRVGVVGTGSSAVQVIAEAAKCASSVTIFQIEPNWILPKKARDFTGRERRLNRNPLVYSLRRRKLYAGYDLRQMRTSHARRDGMANRRRHKASVEFVKSSLASRPDLCELVTPEFPFEAKRTVISDNYYPTLLRPNVSLVPQAVKGLTATGAIDADGEEHELDVIVLATGFQASNYLANFTVTGPNGVELHEQWAGEPTALLGALVPGFPNFFIMFGPNTNAIPLISFYEAQASLAAKAIRRLVTRGYRQVEVSKPLTVAFNEWLQARLAKTVWGEADSYFKAASGRIVTQWPFSASTYIMATRLARRVALRYR
jgi:cation diffusion facilitator CzcD-associated flavoprotein CzcO